MGFLNTLLAISGFAIGIPLGLFLGFLFFIHFESKDVEKADPIPKSLDDVDSSVMVDLIPELPLWVMSPDYERVDWLNHFFLDMWPHFDKAVCGIIKTAVEPYAAEYVGKYKISAIYFEHLTLGNLPPKIHGLKAQDSKENELVLDVALKWAGNCDIALAIKILSLKLTVQLVDIQVSAAARLVMRPFVPTFPCFASIAISLMEKPKIDFGLKIMGADLMSIPGLYQFVQEIVARQVAKLYLWPQTFEVDILDVSIGAAKKPVGILHVKVVKANNLLKMDFLGASDPYVKLSLTGERLPSKKTTVIMNNLNPVWNEDFKMIVKEPENQVLQMHLFDWEQVGAHDYLGMQVYPLNELAPYEKKVLTLDLVNSTDPDDPRNKKPRGSVTVELTFVPFLEDSKKYNVSGPLDFSGNGGSFKESMCFSGSGLLTITVIEAEDVEGRHHNNPFAIIIYKGEKRKTKILKKTRDPIWNEEFQFVLDETPLKDTVYVEVMSRRRRTMGILSKESLGYVEVNLADVVYNGHIKEKYHLINSRDGIIHLDIRWKMI